MRVLKQAWTEEDEAAVWGRFEERFTKLTTSVSRVVVAPEPTIHMALLGLFAGGHVLLDDLPGVGKTLLAKTIARSIDGRFSRIQFTPDLLPTDITGTSIFDMQQSRFEFVPGPVFANIVLADEVNRTGPRTQSALLEAMEEHQVTVDGATRPLPVPFMVIATQNLVESHGTFPLPSSQLDRFLVSMKIGLPSIEEEVEILTRSETGPMDVPVVLTIDDVVDMRGLVRQVHVSPPVREYVANLVSATRGHAAVAVGVSPRGAVALQRAGQAWAAFHGRPFLVPEDVKDVAPAVLAHRMMVDMGAGATSEEVVLEVLGTVQVPL